MFFLTFSNIWSFSFFFLLTYTTFILSLIVYVLPISNVFSRFSSSKNKNFFLFINSTDLLYILLTPYFLFFIFNLSWSSPAVSVWFGHLIYSSFQNKMISLILANFFLVLVLFNSVTYFTSREIYDYMVVLFNFCYWMSILFLANSIFTTIFIIEVISTLIFLLITTSTFSSGYFYRNLDLSFGHIFQNSTPHTFVQSILYFFWISLISSLSLFLFILFFYFKMVTFDWYLSEHIFVYFISVSCIKDIFSFGTCWFILLFSIFLKCGIAPLYVWKPMFFKGIPMYTVFFYVSFIYFYLFLFIIHMLNAYFSEIFYFYSLVTIIFLLIGLVTLLFILCEAFYIKAFIALSSILNSLFVLLALVSTHINDILFWL